jgi:DNA-binding GntR family transcriptional regulator
MDNDAPPVVPRSRKDITGELAVLIVEHIRAQALQPGAHLPAQELADIFKVSRSPVIQALRLLEEKQLVTHVPNHGFYLAAQVPETEDLGFERRTHLSTIYFKMAEDRLRGELKDQVSERSLRQSYGLTRGEVHELLNRMTQEGWAERRPGYGWTLAPVLTTPKALEQSYRLRIALEPASLIQPGFELPRQAAQRARASEQQLLDGGIETMSPDALYERGVRFHEMLAEASNNPFFLDTLRRINRMRRLFTYRAMADRARYYGQVKDHIRILDLLIENKNHQAADQMRAHLDRVLANIQKIKTFD